MKKYCLLFVASVVAISGYSQQYQLLSPDKKTEVKINFSGGFYYSVNHNGVPLLDSSVIGLIIHDKPDLFRNKVYKKEQHAVNQVVYPVVREKRKEIIDNYN